MAFWNQTDGKDPKRNFRFQIMMTGDGFPAGGVIWWAKKVGKPNFTVGESKHSFLNHTYYWPGRVEWQTVTMTLVDPVDIAEGTNNGTVQHLNEIFEAAGYKPPSVSGDALVTQSKAKMATGLGDVKIIQVDAEGLPVETWTLHAPFIKKITYGELDYENDDLTQIEVEFRYDYATCETVGNPEAVAFVAGDLGA